MKTYKDKHIKLYTMVQGFKIPTQWYKFYYNSHAIKLLKKKKTGENMQNGSRKCTLPELWPDFSKLSDHIFSGNPLYILFINPRASQW